MPDIFGGGGSNDIFSIAAPVAGAAIGGAFGNPFLGASIGGMFAGGFGSGQAQQDAYGRQMDFYQNQMNTVQNSPLTQRLMGLLGVQYGGPSLGNLRGQRRELQDLIQARSDDPFGPGHAPAWQPPNGGIQVRRPIGTAGGPSGPYNHGGISSQQREYAQQDAELESLNNQIRQARAGKMADKGFADLASQITNIKRQGTVTGQQAGEQALMSALGQSGGLHSGQGAKALSDFARQSQMDLAGVNAGEPSIKDALRQQEIGNLMSAITGTLPPPGFGSMQIAQLLGQPQANLGTNIGALGQIGGNFALADMLGLFNKTPPPGAGGSDPWGYNQPQDYGLMDS